MRNAELWQVERMRQRNLRGSQQNNNGDEENQRLNTRASLSASSDDNLTDVSQRLLEGYGIDTRTIDRQSLRQIGQLIQEMEQVSGREEVQRRLTRLNMSN